MDSGNIISVEGREILPKIRELFPPLFDSVCGMFHQKKNEYVILCYSLSKLRLRKLAKYYLPGAASPEVTAMSWPLLTVACMTSEKKNRNSNLHDLEYAILSDWMLCDVIITWKKSQIGYGFANCCNYIP